MKKGKIFVLLLCFSLLFGNMLQVSAAAKSQLIACCSSGRKVTLNSCSLNTLYVNRPEGPVHIVAQGVSTINRVILATGACLEENTLAAGSDGFITVQVITNEKTVLCGDFSLVRFEIAGTKVYMDGGRTNNLEITTQAPGAELTLERGTTIETLVVDAPATVTGPGLVETAIVNENGVSFDTAPAVSLVLAQGVTVLIGGQEVGAPEKSGPSYSDSSDEDEGGESPHFPAYFVLTGMGIAPESAGEAAGKIYAEYKLVADEEDISLAMDKVEYIKIKIGAGDWEYLTANTDATLWFNIEKATGNYEFEIKTADGRVYAAILDWQEEIKEAELTATDKEETRPGSGDKYVELAIKENYPQLPLADADVKLIAQKEGEKWVELEPGMGSILWFNNGTLWFKRDKETGTYEFFIVTGAATDTDAIYKVTLEWTKPAPAKVIQLAAGNAHSLALKDDGTVWAWGANNSGQLGDGTTAGKNTPVEINSFLDAIVVTAGNVHSLALSSASTVWSWGGNSSGQLGDNSTSGRISPVQVKNLTDNLTDVQAIAAGDSHSLALKDDGTVLAWGKNGNGQLGNGSTVNRMVPVQVKNLTGVQAIAAGGSHSLALKDDGIVWAWGNNSSGQLGNGTTTNRSVPFQVESLTNVQAIAAGASHSLALTSEGKVYAWGNNSSGQLGEGTTTNSSTPVQINDLPVIQAISAGSYHSLALDAEGRVWAWGSNNKGQLGIGSTEDSNTPVEVNNNLSNVRSIAAGFYHSLALKMDGIVYAWGYNSDGRLGDGTTDDSNTPVLAHNL